jgi:sulfotransferase family protein
VTQILFVSGFNRSGTTLVTSAATKATKGGTLTVGHLAKHMPSVDEFLRESKEKGTSPDRGVDQLKITETTPEEYGWLLLSTTGQFTFGDKAKESGILQTVADEIAKDAEEPVVVLKNPFDIGQEQLLLDSFPGSKLIMLRRKIGAIEHSLGRAWERLRTSNAWTQALIGGPEHSGEFLELVADPKQREAMVTSSVEKTRKTARTIAKNAPSLPLNRTAFLSYDELRSDPEKGAAWAKHILDPSAFARAISEITFPEYHHERSDSLKTQMIDAQWALSWRRVRSLQRRRGIL